jgi:hypothetical protein
MLVACQTCIWGKESGSSILSILWAPGAPVARILWVPGAPVARILWVPGAHGARILWVPGADGARILWVPGAYGARILCLLLTRGRDGARAVTILSRLAHNCSDVYLSQGG